MCVRAGARAFVYLFVCVLKFGAHMHIRTNIYTRLHINITVYKYLLKYAIKNIPRKKVDRDDALLEAMIFDFLG